MFSLDATATRCRDALVGIALSALAGLAAAPDAMARDGPPRFAMQRGAQAEARGARQAERAQQRAARVGQQRETPQRAPDVPPLAGPPAQGQGPESTGAPGGRPGRMTLDERRALRQQINDAARNVYRPNRP